MRAVHERHGELPSVHHGLRQAAWKQVVVALVTILRKRAVLSGGRRASITGAWSASALDLSPLALDAPIPVACHLIKMSSPS